MNLNVRGARLDVARSGVDAEGRRQVAEIVRHRLALEVNAAVSAYRRTRAELVLAARNRELAAHRAELARALFEAGRASADSVSDAESDGIGADLAELAARRKRRRFPPTAFCMSWAPWCRRPGDPATEGKRRTHEHP
jgi:outer membrane protein TolC